jgi:hypothetical protein
LILGHPLPKILLGVSADWQATCDNTRKRQSHAACEAHVRVPSEPDTESRTPLSRVADALRGWKLARTTHTDCRTEIWHSHVIVSRFVPNASQSSRDYALQCSLTMQQYRAIVMQESREPGWSTMAMVSASPRNLPQH